ncbi:MAG: DNA topoisomerase 1 [Bdellovibrionaceae bacterium]|nr:DNA topoisomerase 1 [Pseudobdellovibrionaceae bacterium]
MKLVIVESPAKCSKIESFLGKGYKCIASFGHIRQIANGLKSIDIDNKYKVTYKTLSKKSKYITALKKAIAKADEVILATDDDREGEAIAWHICKTFKLPIKTTKRIIFHEITKTAIKNAIKTPTVINMNKVNSQMARQVLDLLVGFTISPILWKHISRKAEGSLSAGRCQTPALKLIYEQQKLIDKSPGRKVYDTNGIFTDKNLNFHLNHHHKDEDKIEEFLEKSKVFQHKYSCTTPKKVTKCPPKPFTTSTLQQKSSNEFSYSPKMTMRLAQTLYENGHITYMRTDNAKYSKEFVDTAKDYIKNNFGETYINKNIGALINNDKSKKSDKSDKSKKSDKKNNAQEAHEAIRPTHIETTTLLVKNKITAREIKLYNLIWRNTIESCMSSAIYNSITGKITAPDKHVYKYSSEQAIFPGWKIVAGYEEINPIYKYLLSLPKGKLMKYKEIYSKVALKDLKKNYTEAKLVQMLEKKGIGRPSTFSNLISKIQERNYVKKQDVPGKQIHCIDFKLVNAELTEIESDRVFGNEKKKLVIQPIGIIVYEFLEKYFDNLFNYDYTKEMEDNLDVISKGKKTWYTLCEQCNMQMKELSKKIVDKKKVSYRIDDHHVYMIGRYGPVIKYEKDGETSFKGVKKNLNMNKLKNGEYTLRDVLDDKKSSSNNKILGTYKEKEVILKKGRYGMYITYDNKNTSVKSLKKDFDDIVLQDVKDILDGKITTQSNIIKKINEEISIRKGRYGHYVYYKTNKMKKPKFISLKGVDQADVDIAWVEAKL